METCAGRIGLVLRQPGGVSTCIAEALSAVRNVSRPLGARIEWLPLFLERLVLVIEPLAIVTESISIAPASLVLVSDPLAVAIELLAIATERLAAPTESPRASIWPLETLIEVRRTPSAALRRSTVMFRRLTAALGTRRSVLTFFLDSPHNVLRCALAAPSRSQNDIRTSRVVRRPLRRRSPASHEL